MGAVYIPKGKFLETLTKKNSGANPKKLLLSLTSVKPGRNTKRDTEDVFYVVCCCKDKFLKKKK